MSFVFFVLVMTSWFSFERCFRNAHFSVLLSGETEPSGLPSGYIDD